MMLRCLIAAAAVAEGRVLNARGAVRGLLQREDAPQHGEEDVVSLSESSGKCRFRCQMRKLEEATKNGLREAERRTKEAERNTKATLEAEKKAAAKKIADAKAAAQAAIAAVNAKAKDAVQVAVKAMESGKESVVKAAKIPAKMKDIATAGLAKMKDAVKNVTGHIKDAKDKAHDAAHAKMDAVKQKGKDLLRKLLKKDEGDKEHKEHEKDAQKQMQDMEKDVEKEEKEEIAEEDKAFDTLKDQVTDLLQGKGLPFVPTPGPGVSEAAVKDSLGQNVYKDGYWSVTCVSDALQRYADKHSIGHKIDYKAEDANISVVRYSHFVPKEDQKPMTPPVCYEFCRTVKDMHFFGITNGRDCYCAPYFKKSAEGGSEMCDLPCDGNPSTMCGGKGKSSIWVMHLAGETEKLYKAAWEELEKVVKDDLFLKGYESCGLGKGHEFSKIGEMLEKAAQTNGDENTSKFGNELRVFAASKTAAMQKLEAVEKFHKDNEGPGKPYEQLEADLKDKKEGAVQKVEKLMGEIESETAAGQAEFDIEEEYRKAHGCGKMGANGPEFSVESDDKALESYRLATQVSRVFDMAKDADGKADHSIVEQTCSGEQVGEAIIAASEEACAQHCQKTTFPTKCVAFQWFSEGSDSKYGACIMFSKVEKVRWFNNGGSEGSHDDQKKCSAGADAKCWMSVAANGGWKPEAVKDAKVCFAE